MWYLVFSPYSSILVSSDQWILFLMVWESFRCLLANSKRTVVCLLLRSGFRLANPPWWFQTSSLPNDVQSIEFTTGGLQSSWHAPTSTVGPYIDRCVPFQIMSNIEFTTGGLQSSCRNISRMINWNRMHLSSILSLILKGLNTYSWSRKFTYTVP